MMLSATCLHAPEYWGQLARHICATVCSNLPLKPGSWRIGTTTGRHTLPTEHCRALRQLLLRPPPSQPAGSDPPSNTCFAHHVRSLVQLLDFAPSEDETTPGTLLKCISMPHHTA